jgi:hypothetical protein
VIELLGIGIALTIGPLVANALMEAVAAVDDARWAWMSFLLREHGVGGSQA